MKCATGSLMCNGNWQPAHVTVTHALDFKSRNFVPTTFDDVLRRHVNAMTGLHDAPNHSKQHSAFLCRSNKIHTHTYIYIARQRHHAGSPQNFEIHAILADKLARCNVSGFEKNTAELRCCLFGHINVARKHRKTCNIAGRYKRVNTSAGDAAVTPDTSSSPLSLLLSGISEPFSRTNLTYMPGSGWPT
jgi:hypothetical protein